MKRTLALALFMYGLTAAMAADENPMNFVDATPGSGIEYRNVCGFPVGSKGWLNEGMGAGAAWLDYDNDGNLDLYIVNGSDFDRKPGEGEPNKLFRGDGKGQFTDVSAKAGVAHRGWGYGVTAADYDNDGDPDIYVTNMGPNVLYRNNGDGTFTDVTAKAGVAGLDIWSASTAFFDMEHDGDLDLYVDNYMVCTPDTVAKSESPEAVASNCAYRGIQVFCGPLGQVPHQDSLYRNNGDGTFTNVAKSAGIWQEEGRYALGVVVADLDNDGDSDVYVANDSVGNFLWQNDGKGNFTDVGLMKLAAFNADGRAQAGMGTNSADYNNDGWMDLIVTNFSQDLNTVYKNMSGKFFMDDTALVGLNVTHMRLSWGVGFYDFDLDTDLDLFIANGHVYPQLDGYQIGTEFRQYNHMFVNEAGRFIESHETSGPGFKVLRSFRAAAFGDYDNDGDVDVFVTTLDDIPLLLRNDTPRNGRHFLQVRLIGEKANRDAIGARVTLSYGGKTRIRERKGGGSYQAVEDPRLHFGVGTATKIDTLHVRWPGGTTDVLKDVKVDQVVTIREGQTN